MMRRFFLSLAVLSIFVLPAAAADPTGDWLVEDGSARMRLAGCDGNIWGIVAWANTRDVDSNNPDPSQRHRPIVGLPIIRGMHSVKPNQWEGPIYNPKNGKTYDGTITMTRPDLLKVEGCVLGRWICGGQEWLRVPITQSSVGASPLPDLCSILFPSPGLPHQGGLK